MSDLTKRQEFILQWLSEAETSALGECKGSDLDRLVELGLAWIAPVPDGMDRDYARVSVTVRGHEKLAETSTV